MTRSGARLMAVLAPLAFGLACDPIKGTPRQGPPTNACSEQACEAYKPARIAATCNEGRCEFAERPDFTFTFAIDVPNTALYGAGQTFLIAGHMLYDHPATSLCPVASCLPLLAVGDVTGAYTVTQAVGVDLGVAMAKDTSFPVQAVFVPRFDGQDALAQGLPVGTLFAVSRLVQIEPDSPPSLLYRRALPAGRYLRYSYPLPPFDEVFPPLVDVVQVQSSRGLSDDAKLETLDNPTGELRTAKIAREEGLGGFRAWLADSTSRARISSIRTLSGTTAEVRLDTVGQNQEGGTALRENVDVIVAPPDGTLGLPRFESALIGGAGLDNIIYWRLPAPATVNGVVAITSEDDAGGGLGFLTGVPSRLHFESQSIRDVEDVQRPLLHYSSDVFTDDAGRFSTVLPPGVYSVTLEPAEGTGFGKFTSVLNVTGNIAPTFQPPRRTLTKGRAVLSDGRPLGQAEVVANPAKIPSDSSSWSTASAPRAGRTRTADDGSFQFELDEGTYEISVQPQSNTGFPRMVTIRGVGGLEQDLQTLEVPVPTRMSFAVRGGDNGVPIVRATVRILAQPEGGGPAVQVAMAMTDEDGQCEILLARQPR
ncbi:hypothetical protein AKJ09_09637 [Labilithrix luteola]|uniref:Carboxypeptidase regulatory-like domain-containing protein n=1 Tax=Labilithrix luteola TaxID=1391654 RepID=A0A0K1QB54_9BACT|nr:hypothetical protein [Labilithrix luteola]AKV02974.1 hypothetical protein AKJ09_09637 [Labilithrix luteola]